jgi:uncharacterized membrane protein
VPQHRDSWGPTGFSPNQLLGSVFNLGGFPNIASQTLLQALSFDGGPTLADAVKVLLRQAVAAILNAAHPNVDYPLTAAQIIANVNTAIATNNRSTILAVKDTLAGFNERGCPLN